jgi:hypothetical protein
MKTCGMMGEVVGKAASICALYDCDPRDVYEDHLEDLIELIRLPGKARRSTPSGEITIPDDALPLAGPMGPPTGQDATKLEGVVVDDNEASLEGSWTEGSGLKNYVNYGYRYASPKSGASATFTLRAPKAGSYLIELFSQSHPNRSTNTPVTLRRGDFVRTFSVDQRTKSPEDRIAVDTIDLKELEEITVTIGTENADGTVHIDAVRMIESK